MPMRYSYPIAFSIKALLIASLIAKVDAALFGQHLLIRLVVDLSQLLASDELKPEMCPSGTT